MPDQGQERTEEATPKRREDARKRGQFARSNELPGAIALLAGTLGLRIAGPGIWTALTLLVQNDLARVYRADLTPNDAVLLISQGMLAIVLAVAPVFGALALGGLAAGLLQTGLLLSPAALTPKFDKVNPLTGFKRLFSANTGFELFKVIVRLVILGAVISGVMSGMSAQLSTLASVGVMGAPGVIGNLAQGCITQVALAGGILAVVDFGYQRWHFNRELRMSRQEVRDEMRQSEGDPQIRARIRRLQRQRAKQRMMQEVPKATVILANPTHFAVALRYTSGEMRAPIVVAKGQDYVAQQIKALARLHNVPIVEQPALARAIFASVPIGREIPTQFYRAVAEVLAVLYQLRRRW